MLTNWKTTLAGLIPGLTGIAWALMDAYNAGTFNGKNGVALFMSIGFIILGAVSKDHNTM